MQVRFLSGAFLRGDIIESKKVRQKGRIVLKKENKMKELWNAFIDWCKDIGGLVKENKLIMTIIFAFIIVIVAAIGISVALGNSGGEEAALATEISTTEETTVATTEEALEQDAYPAVNELMKKYYQAMADGDVETLLSLTEGLDQKEQIKIAKKSEYIEGYPVLTCYTKNGLTENAFIVYAYYEVKLTGFETCAPGLNTWYVVGDGAGNYVVSAGEQSADVIAYCESVSAQDDVVDLFNTVQVKYNDLRTNDVELSAFLDELPELLTAAVGEELAKIEAEEAKIAEEQAKAEEEQSKEEAEDKPVVIVKTVKTTDVVNVRSSDSETADKVGKAQKGEEFDLVEEKANGWSKIIFEGKEAFIKSEFLVAAKEETVEPSEEESKEDESKEDDSKKEESKEEDESDNEGADVPANGTFTVTQTLNVRKSASETADKIGVCYPGDTIEIIMKQADGWTKVKFKGQTGYIKSDVLK